MGTIMTTAESRPLQPHKGSSETRGWWRLRVGVKSFNPTRVRLKPDAPATTRRSCGRFNPTRVRLKLAVNLYLKAFFEASTPQGFV